MSFLTARLLGYVSASLGALLTLSVATNCYLWNRHEKDVETIGALEERGKQSAAAAVQCSDGVDELARAAAARHTAAMKMIVALQGQLSDIMRQAEATLAAAPTVPGDACASALEMSRKKIAERKR